MGEKLSSVQDWFEKGKSTRQFSNRNESTGNWLVFYFSKSEQRQLQRELENIVRLKLIKEVHWKKFNYGIYGFGFQVSLTYPPRLFGMTNTIVMGADEVKGKYSEKDLEDSKIVWGTEWHGTPTKIEEFPSD